VPQYFYDSYTALSYVWGDHSDKRTIFIGDKLFEVTRNLAAALHALRHNTKIFQMWADAISIDQTNIPERNQQVELMGQIYSLAQQTLIYLGESTKETDVLMDTAQLSNLNPFHQKLAAIHILSRSWIKQVWTDQELVLSRKVWIQCGQRRMSWNELYENLKMELPEEHSSPERAQLVQNANHNLRLLHEMRNVKNSFQASLFMRDKPSSLFLILLSRRGFGMSDSRDMIFAHRGIADLNPTRDAQELLPVDYSKSVKEIFTDATRFMLEFGDDEVLLHVEARDPGSRMPGLPSWVPDWSLPSSQYLTPIPCIGDTSYSLLGWEVAFYYDLGWENTFPQEH
jgi:hypothetical protein